MSSLDFKYMDDLLRKTKATDGNAFAELFAATYPKQYAFAVDFLGDTFLAQQVIQETYIYALSNISKIQESTILAAWLNQIVFRICFRVHGEASNDRDYTLESETVHASRGTYSLRRVLSLPFSEAQTIVLKYYCGMKKRKIASLLEIRPGAVTGYLKSGLSRLNQYIETEGERA